MEIICSKPAISSYNFMRYLVAALAKNKKVIVELPLLVDSIYKFKKQNEQFQYLFEDIEFRTGIDNTISSDISDGINNLQTFGIVGKLNLTYEKIVIYLTKEDAEKMLEECNDSVKVAMEQLASVF